MIRRPPRSTLDRSSAASDVYKRQHFAHGNIVRAFDFFTVVRRFEDGDTHETQYGVMELVEGGDLADYLKKKPAQEELLDCLLYTSPSPRDRTRSRMPSSA